MANPQAIMSSECTGFHGLDAQVGVAIRRVRVGAGGRGEVQDRIQLAGDKDVFRDILFDKSESFISGQMGKIGRITGHEIIQPNHFMAFCQETIAEM
jgi:hypothetical protein